VISSKRKVRFARRPDKTRAVLAAPASQNELASGRIPRIARLMALAIHFERLLREGKVRDQSELARLARVTQPRMTQVMNLNLLAPDIQDELLHLAPTTKGRERVHERTLRSLAAEMDWERQRATWSRQRRAIDRTVSARPA
jgi:hypothetical protein